MATKTAMIFSLILFPLAIFANLENEMNKFFNNLGSSSNVSSAEIYNGQKAGYATGGSVTIRNRSMRLQPATVNLPRFDAGCGGIDIYTGGFSFVSSDQLIQALKTVGSSTVGYAFLLGLETVSPQVANTIKQMQTWANAINANSINSCEVASQLVGSVWPKDSMASQHICQTTGAHYGFLSDRIDGRHQCSKAGNKEKKAEIDNKTRKENPNLIIGDYNIAWEAIQKQGFLTKDNEIAEFLMTLMGTIIVRDDEVETFPAMAMDESYIKTFLEGGDSTIYSCDSKQKLNCLFITQKKIVIGRNTSWGGKIENLLISIQEKILCDEELSNEERELLVKTNFPLYKFLNVITAYKKGVCPIDVKQISDIVAIDLLVQYLRGSLESIRIACAQLKNRMAYTNKVDEYLESLKIVERSISYYDTRTSHLMEQELYILQKMELLEAQIASEICLG